MHSRAAAPPVHSARLAGLLAALLLALSLAARCEPFHAWVHADRTAGAAACVLCLFLQAQVSTAETQVAAALILVAVAFQPGKCSHAASFLIGLPPGRGPPMLSLIW